MTRRSQFSLRTGLAGSIAALALAPVLGAAPAFAQLASTSSVAASTPSDVQTSLPQVTPGFAPIGSTTFAAAPSSANTSVLGAGTQLAQIAPLPFASTTAPLNASAGSPATENVQVTGSRLRTSNTTSAAPITVITSAQITQSSAQTLEDVLRKIPSIGTQGIFGSTNNGGNGASCIDLRNLGINRTLVLVDGRRFVHTPDGTGSDCVDFDTIPLAMVDRVEILKDGASTIYGADAIAGVINVILKKNFVGTQINVGGNVSASGDDKQGDIQGTTGFDFAQGRGNVALSGRYLDRGPILQKDRDWATPAAAADAGGPGDPYTIGSGYPVAGRIFGAGLPKSGDTVISNQLQPFQNTYNGAGINPNINGRYDFGATQQLSDRETQGNFAGNSHFDINDHATVYLQGFYTHKATQEQLSGQPITGNPNTGQSFDIPQGNPFAEALGLNEELQEYRRDTDFATRVYKTSSDTWQLTGGVRGNIIGNYNYDLYYSYGRAVNTITTDGQINFTHLEQTVGFQSLNDPGNIDAGTYNTQVCISPCALGNPFGAGNYSAAAARYATFSSVERATYQFRDIGGTVTNNKIVQLPYGPLGVAIGFEHRGEQGSDRPDPIIQTGQSTAAISAPTGGGFNVTEAFGELQIPILKNLVGVKDLSGNISGRWSDYNTFGSVENYKLSLNYSPTRDIRFRANVASGTRQPAISEAFGGDTLSFNTANDPCGQVSSYGALAGIVGANCTKQGVGPSSGYKSSSTQIATITGGNPNLQPETSHTYTIGTVITPRWTPALAITVDYFHTKIANQINSLNTQFIADSCYTSVNFSSPQCAAVGARTATGQISTVSAVETNLGEVHTNGIDADISYLIRLGGGNNIQLSTDLTDTIGYTEQLVPGGPFVNLKGRLSTVSTNILSLSGYPVIRDNSTITYSKGGFSFSWTLRYIDGLLYNNGGDADPTVNRFTRTNEVFYHDIEATYNWKKFQVVAGIDNVFDRTPPFVIGTGTNTEPAVYDVIGRLFYAKLQFRF